MLDHVETIVKSSGMSYEVLIDDVQEAIDQENPTLSQSAQEELEGRKGLIFLL